MATDAATRRINAFLYSSLYRLNANLVAVEDLAAAPPRIGKEQTWLVPLRAGLTFSDGSAIRASDVAFTYRLALSANCPFGDEVCRLVPYRIVSMRAESPLLVSFKLRRSVPTFVPIALTGLAILPERAVRASYDRFRNAAEKVDAAKVNAVSDRIGAATNDDKCLAESPPPQCDLGFYVNDLESILRSADVGLPEAARFRLSSGSRDDTAYASALLDLVQGLVASLGSKDVDAIAAAFPLLDFQRKPVGSGPYGLTSYRPAESVVMTRHAPGAGGEVPRVARAAILSDPAAAATALKTGDVDWLPEVSPDEVPELETDAAVRVAGRPGTTYRAIVFNVRPGHVYADTGTRKAFAMCIDKQALIEKATSGRGMVAWSPTSPVSWAYRRSTESPPYDPDAAQQLLIKVGWRRGPDTIFVRRGQRLSSQIYVRPSRADQLSFAQAASAQLKRCGIELHVSELGFSGDVLLRQIGWPNEFDTFLAENAMGSEPAIDFSSFSSARVTSRTNPGDANFGGWSNRTADSLIAAAGSALDRRKRVELYGKLQDLIAQEVPLIPLWYEPAYAGVSKRLVRSTGAIDPSEPFYDWDADRWLLKRP